MKKNLLMLLALLLGMTAMQAKPVDINRARRLGLNFVQHKALFAHNDIQSLDLAYVFRGENGMATAYVFNFDGGFVIVAADDCSSPILGYSDCGDFNFDQAPDGLLFMMAEHSRGIEMMVNQGLEANSDILSRWDNIEDFGAMCPAKGQPVVGPLIELKWNQDSPYNMYVPSGCPTGCVATAMAQLMKYWNWPAQGTGEHSYQWNGQTLSANFGETTYDWDNMVNSYTGSTTQEQKEAVATLMYHCGVSVNMQYAPDGSGAYSADVPVSINAYFSYSDHATHISKGGNYDEWIALLKSNIDQQIPIYYSGQSSQGGHAFICDGYDENDLFHFNWGWGGSNNGYFLIDGEHFDYSGSQAIVYDFIPDYVYNNMPKAPENFSIGIDSDVSRTAHLTWTNPSETEAGNPLAALDKVVVKRNGIVVQELTDVVPGQVMSCDDEVPYFDQFEYTVIAVSGDLYGRTALATAVFGPYCEWTVIMTSASFQGWDGGGITVQNAAGSYIDFLTTTTASAQMQRFQMALGNNNFYWTAPNSSISNLSFKIKDAENQIVYQYEGPSSGLETGLLRTINNTCGNEVTCEAPYHLKAVTDPENDRNIILTWESDFAPEFGYNIYRDGFLFNMAHELQYVDENTDVGGHCYYVTALCSGGETANSNEYCATSGSGCDAPVDLHFAYTNNHKVQLRWTAPENENVTGYVLYRKTEDSPYKWIKNISASATTYNEMSAQQYMVYQYALVTYYGAIDCSSAYANDLFDPDKFFVTVDWSSEPKDLQAVFDEDDHKVNLLWKPAFLASSYDIMRNGEKIGETANETTFEDLDLTAGETYCYQVVAHGDGFEETSNEVCVEMPAAPEPPVLPCSDPTHLFCDDRPALGLSSAIHVEWQAPEDRVPDSYTLFVYDMIPNDTIANDTTILTGLTETVYETGYSIDGTDKIFQVKAVYPECESDFALTANGEDFVRFTSLSVSELDASVNLYPNPTSGLLTIEAEHMNAVGLYNLVGQCLMGKTAENDNAILDLNGLLEGVYFVKVTTSQGSIVKKVVKM